MTEPNASLAKTAHSAYAFGDLCYLRAIGMEVRKALPQDAAAACTVMRRSITELCEADHRNDPAMLGRWLANKTPENFASWIANANNTVLVAIEAQVIIAVGAVTHVGEITLNYVSPDARFRGVSRAMMQALEARARDLGHTRCTLVSTRTARRFYLGMGYLETGAEPAKLGNDEGLPMEKSLTPAD